jgi:ribokinase
VDAALAMGRKHGLTNILDPAPGRPLPPDLLARVDICTPNETEIESLADSGAPAAMALQLASRGPRTVVLKMGEAGVMLADNGNVSRFLAPKVSAVDTVAAGDCFNGALAVALAEGTALPEAIVFANRAAALSVTRPGAQSSLPTRQEVSAFAA